MYTLLNASTLGFDLARLPSGGAVAEVLLDALALGPGDVGRVLDAPCGPGDVGGSDPWQVQDVLELMSGGEPEVLVAMAATLRTATLGDLQRLTACLRREWLGWLGDDGGSSPGAAVLRVYEHAVGRAWRGDGTGWTPRAAAPVGVGPQAALLDVLLQRVARVGAGQAAALEQEWCRRPADGRWAQAMHAATWAVELTGRQRCAMAAQLRLVLALRTAGLGADAVAGGAWNALSGVVQAVVVADLLDSATQEVLVGPGLDIARPIR